MSVLLTPSPPEVPPIAVRAADGAKLIGVSRSQFWKLHASARLPAPVYLGTKAPRWRVDELREWVNAGAPDRATWTKARAGK